MFTWCHIERNWFGTAIRVIGCTMVLWIGLRVCTANRLRVLFRICQFIRITCNSWKFGTVRL